MTPVIGPNFRCSHWAPSPTSSSTQYLIDKVTDLDAFGKTKQQKKYYESLHFDFSEKIARRTVPLLLFHSSPFAPMGNFAAKNQYVRLLLNDN
jgi:hypothetical protein